MTAGFLPVFSPADNAILGPPTYNFGSIYTGIEFLIDFPSLYSPCSVKAKIRKGMWVDKPEGFKTESAIKAGAVRVAVASGSVCPAGFASSKSTSRRPG